MVKNGELLGTVNPRELVLDGLAAIEAENGSGYELFSSCQISRPVVALMSRLLPAA